MVNDHRSGSTYSGILYLRSLVMQVMKHYLVQLWNNRPLLSIVIIALIVRLVAVVFAQGYGMHDDHFLVIEASQSWVDGTDYNNWLPQNQVNPKPEGHSFFYVGIHYLIFLLFKHIGLADPVFKMYIIRLLHALLSLVVVVYGYKITLKLSNSVVARQVGLVLALLWFIPNMSVRNLVEMVSIPFLVLGTWQILTADAHKYRWLHYFLAGLVVGVAFSIRFQTILFIGGMGLAMLFAFRWRETILFGLGVLCCIFLFQGMVDMFIWQRPFAELTEYIRFNIANKDYFGTKNPFMYFEIVLGFIIPPVGVFLFFGFLRSWKKYLLIFLPTAIFFAFHTFFPNKQERFILTIIPFIIILGFIGWNEFVEKSKFWQGHPRLLKGCFTFFWVINFLLLAVVTTSYSKRSRVESMVYLSKFNNDYKSVIIEDTNKENAAIFPSFYARKWIIAYGLCMQKSLDTISPDSVRSEGSYRKEIYSLNFFDKFSTLELPEYVLFVENANITQRVARMKAYFPGLAYQTTIEPSNMDKFLHWLNPNNKNFNVYIYKTNANQ